MQLKNLESSLGSRELGAALTTATCALLGTGTSTPAIAQDLGKWRVDAGGLYYSEQHRVSDYSVNVLARTQPFEDRLLSFNLSFDTLSGASPNGAAPSAAAQAFPRPITLTRTSGGSVATGGGNFIVRPGALPLDDSFQDTRFAGSTAWQRPMGRLGLVSFGGSLSTEHDYEHIGLDTHVSHDFNSRNTTLAAGLELSDDSVKPIGGSPLPFTALSLNAASIDGSRAKQVRDALIGVTQVFTQHTIGQLNYSISRSNGYLTDPYKVLSVVDPVTGNLVAGPDAGIGLYLYEQRPDTRDKRSLFGLLKHDFGGNVLDGSLRLMTDDWGVRSQTLDMHFRWSPNSEHFLEPHVRFYKQTAASFYHTVLFSGTPLPAYATADDRLGKLNAVTVGLKFSANTDLGQFAARLELYRQKAQPSADALVGSLSGLDLTPDLKAIVAEISYRFGR
jgi:hypothetical protein